MLEPHSNGQPNRSWLIIIAGLLGATAVGLGAFHAHGMYDRLIGMGLNAETVDHRMELCETGLKYQLTHAVAILIVGIAANMNPRRLWGISGGLMTLGTLLFSGSLYAIVVTGIGAFGAIAPLGGLSLIIGWLIVAIIGFRR